MSNLGTNTMPSSTKPHIINIPQEAVGHCDSEDEKTITKPSNECGVGSGSSEIEGDVKGCSEKKKRSRGCSVSECSVEVDLEGGDGDVEGEGEIKLCGKVERDCRICHLGLETSGCNESGALIDLGCSCKDDLAAAHKHCAEAWFKIKGNRTCEICGSVARNVTGVSDTVLVVDQLSDADATTATEAAPPHVHQAEATRSFWQGHRFLNFLLACMVFAFVISWLFHFNIPS